MTQQQRTRATLLVLMGLTAARIPLAVALAQLLPDAAADPAANYLAALAQSLIMFALPGWLLKPMWRKTDGAGKNAPGWLLLALAGAALARAVATPLNGWWAGLLRAPVQPVPAVDAPWTGALMLLAAVVIPAIAEELFFRGALLTNLLQSGSRWQAATLTTLMFALMHGSLAGLPGHLIISALLTLLMMHSGSLLAPVTAHMTYNLLALIRWETGPLPAWLAAGGLTALAIALLVRMPRGKARRLPAVEWLLSAAILAAMAAQYLM